MILLSKTIQFVFALSHFMYNKAILWLQLRDGSPSPPVEPRACHIILARTSQCRVILNSHLEWPALHNKSLFRLNRGP